LLILLSLNLQKGVFDRVGSDDASPEEKVFVQVSVSGSNPCLYGFAEEPDLGALLARTGLHVGLHEGKPDTRYASGTKLDVLIDGKSVQILKGQMSGFHKVTLGIPISLNEESVEGLVAVPGIGPKLAAAIVQEREKRRGFKTTAELLSVQGLGPALYARIRGYFSL